MASAKAYETIISHNLHFFGQQTFYKSCRKFLRCLSCFSNAINRTAVLWIMMFEHVENIVGQVYADLWPDTKSTQNHEAILPLELSTTKQSMTSHAKFAENSVRIVASSYLTKIIHQQILYMRTLIRRRQCDFVTNQPLRQTCWAICRESVNMWRTNTRSR